MLSFAAAEVADLLGTSTPSVNSALQRARASIADRVPQQSQQAERVSMVERGVLDELVAAWERADVPGLVGLLAKDVRFTMPPLPAWFNGRENVADFLTQRLLAAPWPLVPAVANAQPGFACYQSIQSVDEVFRLGAVIVLSFRGGRINWIASFLDPDVLPRFGLPSRALKEVGQHAQLVQQAS